MSALHPLSAAQLLDYALAELPADAAEPLEAHLFDCGACGARAHAVESLVRGSAALVRAGALHVVLTRSLLERLEQSGLRVRRYDVPPNGTAACGAGPADELVVLVLRTPPLDAPAREGLSAEWVASGGLASAGTVFERTEDVPTDGQALYIAAPGPWVRQMPPSLSRLRLLSGERELCSWTLDHQGLLP